MITFHEQFDKKIVLVKLKDSLKKFCLFNDFPDNNLVTLFFLPVIKEPG